MTPSHQLDFERQERCNFPEFVYAEFKTFPQICAILDAFIAQKIPVMTTRIVREMLDPLKARFPDAVVDVEARTMTLGVYPKRPGVVKIVSAGTSDMPVAREALNTLVFMGVDAEIVADVGVAGIHRLLAKRDYLSSADVLIAVAGMEGALPSVLGGLFPQPVIAVPSSVGYGVAAGGHTALMAMLTSCASGITVVNIDNGFGAALAALRILSGLQK